MTTTAVASLRRAALAGCTTLLTVMLLPAPAAAQSDSHGLDGARMVHEMVRGHIMATANGVPAELYTYRPTEEVRSLGQVLGHIGNASFMICASALGENSPATGDLEEADKEAMVTGLEAAFAYCDRAYSEMGADRLAEPVDLFGMSMSRLGVLIFNATHNWEHYGNLVTYMRLNDIVPPSSGGMQGG